MAGREEYLKWREAQPKAENPAPVTAAESPEASYRAYREKEKSAAADRANVFIEMAPDSNEAVSGLRRMQEAADQGIDIPADVLTDAKSDIAQQIERGTRRAKLLASSQLSSWVVADPINASLARRDLENLTYTAALISKTAKGIDQLATGSVTRMATKAAESNLDQLKQAREDQDKSFKNIRDEVGLDLQKEYLDLTPEITAVKKYAKTTARYLRSALSEKFDSETLDGFEETLRGELDAALGVEGANSARLGTYRTSRGGARAEAMMAEIGKLPTLSEQTIALGQYAASSPGDFAAWLGLVTVESLPSMVAAAAVGAVTKSPAAAAATLGLTSASVGESNTYNSLVADKGYDLTNPEHRAAFIADPEVRRNMRDRAFAYGAVVGLLDAVSGKIAGTALAKSPMGDLVLQSMTQAALGSSGEALGLLASDQPLNMVDIIVEGLAEFTTAPIEVIGVGRRSLRIRQDAKEDVAFFNALARGAEGSETKREAPAKYREAIAALTKDGPVENLYVDARAVEELFQSRGENAADFLKAVGGVDMEAFTAALDNGGSIAIPTASYATEIAGTDYDTIIREHLKTAPEKMSVAQAREHEEKVAELMESAQRNLDDTESGRRRLEQTVEEARQVVVSELRAQGQTSPTAENNALPLVAFVASRSQRRGMTPTEYIAKYPLPIVRGAMEREAAQAREGLPDMIRAAIPGADPIVVAEALAADGIEIDAATPEEAVASYERYKNALQQGTPQAAVNQDNGTRRLPDLERTSPGPVPGVRELATQYMTDQGLPVRHQASYVKVDVERAKQIADEYEKMKDDPFDPEVRAAYDAMVTETVAQYEALQALGMTFEFIDFEATGDPYNAPRDAIVDMQENNHLWVFPTDSGYGSDAITEQQERENPLLAMTDYEISGRKVRVNDLFRVVHDVFGHGSEGAAFGARGEENAWQAHVRMFTPLAARAMTSETRGQNSWVNFGPFGDQNRADPKHTVFADQKVGLLPEWVSTVGQADDVSAQRNDAAWTEERLTRVTREYEHGAQDTSKARVGFVNPTDFIAATSPDPDALAREAGDLDAERLRGEQQTPFLIVDNDGKVIGHEGRHRMAAMARAGVTRVPVVVKHQGAPAYRKDPPAASETFASQTFESGDSASAEIVVSDTMALTSSNRAAILASMDANPDVLFQGTDAFDKWFGDSEVVDDNGEPLVVYHGTDAEDFSAFQPGSWFSASSSEAGAYSQWTDVARADRQTGRYTKASGAEYAGQRLPYVGILADTAKVEGEVYATDQAVARYLGEGRWEYLTDVAIDYGTYDPLNDTIQLVEGDATARADAAIAEYEGGVRRMNPGGVGGRVYPVYLSIQNPIKLSPFEANRIAKRLGMTEEQRAEVIADYKAQGYDGIVTASDEATADAAVRADLGGVPQQWIVFDAAQVKSVNNRGTYDANNPDILFQAPIPDDTLTLTHWSDAKRDVLDPAKAGSGPLNGAERNRRGPKKVFYGVNVGRKGGYVKENLGSYRHTVKVKMAQLYDLNDDPLQLFDAVPSDLPSPQRMGWVEEKIVAAGYKGYRVVGAQGDTVALFTAEKPTRVRRDREDAKRFTAVDLFARPMTDLPGKPGKPKVIDIATGFNDRHWDRFNRELTPESDEADYKAVYATALEELRTQMREPNSGVGWYSRDVALSIAMASKVYPTLATNQTHRDFFLTMAGIFSNGMTPQQAFAISAEAFEMFLNERRNDGRVPTVRAEGANWGVRNNANVAQLEFINFLVGRYGGLEGAMRWLKEPQSRADINEAMVTSGYHKQGRFTTKATVAGPDLPGFLAFGHKLGRYTMGLHGFEISGEDVTIDMWYIRTYRRWVGGLLRGPLSSEGITGLPNDTDRGVIRRLTSQLAEAMNLPANDVQAVLWFFEKRLWGAQGLRTNEGTNSDGARQLLERKGIPLEDAEGDDGGAGDVPDRRAPNPKDTFEGRAIDELFQRRPEGARGSIVPAVAPGEAPIITLFEGWDLSTFLHESGHYFLYTLQQEARDGGVTDWDTIVEWWGQNVDGIAKDGGATQAQVTTYLRDGTTGDVDVDRKVYVGMQEQWARAFETYLMEGKAPSNALRSAFEAFNAWLLEVYRRVKGNLDVNVSDELRGVFDRMLATDEEIAAAAKENAVDVLVSPSAEALGVTAEEYEKLVRLAGEAQDEARQAMMLEIMAPIRAMYTEEFKAAKAAATKEITAKVNARPANRVREWLGNERWLSDDEENNPNPRKLPLDLRINRQSIIDDYDDGAAIIAALPRGRRPLVTKDTTLSADDVAGWFGYKSGDAMLQDVMTAPAPEKEIKMLVDAEMAKRTKDPLTDGTVAELAVKAIHGEKRGQLIAAELRALNKNARSGKTTTRSQAREIARRTLRRLPIRQAVRSGQFLVAERRAAERSQQAVAKGDLAAAYEAKREQLLNNALYMESKAADEVLAKTEARVAKLKSKGTRKNLAGEYLAAIDDILQAYDFRKSTTQRREKSLAGLLAYVEMMKAEGRENELAIPAEVLDAANKKPYRTLTVAELEGVYDSLVNIEHTARMKKKMRDAQEARVFQEVVDGFTAEMDANLKDKPGNRVPTAGEKRKRRVREFANLLLNTDSILRKIGGFTRGAAYDAMKAPIDEASDRAMTMRAEAADAFAALYAPYSRREQSRMAVKRYYKELNGSFSQWDLISSALNMGNTDNLSRLMDKDSGAGFTPAQVDFIKGKLSQRDWQFVSNSWTLVNSYWPMIVEREKRVTGVAPKKVEASEVETPFGTIEGGYYPIRYDGDMSVNVSQEDIVEIQKQMLAGNFGKAQTRNGHLKERANGSGGRVLKIGVEVMHQHIGQVIHDLAFSEAVVNVNRLLQNDQIKGAFLRKGLLEDHKALELWIQDVAVGQITAGGVFGRLAMKAKNGFTLSKLAFNMSTVALQITGFAQSAAVIGKKNMALGYSDYAKDFLRVGAEIKEMSPFMAERETTFNRDINDVLGDITLGPAASKYARAQQAMARVGFWAMMKVQFYAVDIPTWLGAHRQGMELFNGDEKKARQHADRMVARAQASGTFSDRSAFERGSLDHGTRQNGFVKLFTTLGSYMFAKGNIAYEIYGRTARDIDGLNAKSFVAAMNGLIDMLLIFTLEAVVYNLIKGTLPGMGDGEEGDAEEWAKFLARETALSMMGTVPGVRDLGSSLAGFDAGAYASILAQFGGTAQQIGQGELDIGLFKSISSTAGILTGLPTGQLNKTVNAWYKLEQGEDISPVEFIMGVNR